MKEKQRVRFCWACGRKLWGNHHSTIVTEDGHEHILHKACEKVLKNGSEVVDTSNRLPDEPSFIDFFIESQGM